MRCREREPDWVLRERGEREKKYSEEERKGKEGEKGVERGGKRKRERERMQVGGRGSIFF